MKKNDDFELMNNLPEECKDPEIKNEDFTLTTVDGSVHEQKFQTKPTTFLKDSLRRFRKNKSSVVAGYILGFLILLSIIVPIANTNDVSRAAPDVAFYNLEPKLFDNANGFWDGTVKKSHIEIDPDTMLPDPDYYREEGISNISYEKESFTNDANKYGYNGYVQVGYYSTYGVNSATLESTNSSVLNPSKSINYVLDLTKVQLTLEKFETVDETKINEYNELEVGPKLPEQLLPTGYNLGEVKLNFIYEDEGRQYPIAITGTKKVHNTGTELTGYTETETIDINKVINDYFENELMTPITQFSNFYFQIEVTSPNGESGDHCALVKNLVITPSGDVDELTQAYFVGNTETNIPGISFDDATKLMNRKNEVVVGMITYTNVGYWKTPDLTRYVKNMWLSRCQFASFSYDSYKGNFGTRDMVLSSSDLEKYRSKGYISYVIEFDEYNQVDEDTFEFYILNKEKCPINNVLEPEDIVFKKVGPSGEDVFTADCSITYYKYLGYSSMPKFIFGTDKTGRDMFKYVFEGLRNSLLLGLFTFVICFLFGLAWGSISGYFGGVVDLVMERITDILSGIPWIVVMTLVVLKANESSFWTLALALCLTGWIGTASLTRTQFYRFRGREYVLASRTLGASHARLITKHILPNAMGTIITSCVLMIPAIIFSEATISYLGLGFKNLSSLGVILSNNQSELLTYPYQLIFPSIVIALVMISFNLFGNGLRDAINPSLKGEDE